MMKGFPKTAALATLLLAGNAWALPQENSIEFSNCMLSLPGSPATARAECGFIEVPENPDQPDGRKIPIHVALARATSTETAPDPEVRASMFPRPAPDATTATKVADPESGQEVTAAGERGELLISGATVFDGYLEHDNSDVFTADGFFRTGDLVEICGEGGNYYRIVGRCKDIINRGGMKISPAELDVALEQHPDLLEAAVCAFPDERLGERICACLVPQPDRSPPELPALQEYLLERGFARFKLPERIALFDRLPRNPLGKVQRFALQDAITTRQEK